LLAPRIAQRLGVDPAPVDVHDEAALRWLRACLWPHDRARMLRFDQAAGIVRGAGWPVQAAPDAYAAIEPWLDTLDAGVQPVVFNSWVLAYFEPAALAAHVAAMRALVQRRGIAWLSAEGQGLLLGAGAHGAGCRWHGERSRPRQRDAVVADAARRGRRGADHLAGAQPSARPLGALGVRAAAAAVPLSWAR
jgi:hypothetical protein